MKLLLFIGAFWLLASGCKKSETLTTKDYTGLFMFTNGTAVPVTAQTEIHFNGVNFSGPKDSLLLPFVGTGVFKLANDSIYFTQTGSVPGIISQTTVLEGSFYLEQNADSLVFSRKNPEGIAGAEVRYRLHRN